MRITWTHFALDADDGVDEGHATAEALATLEREQASVAQATMIAEASDQIEDAQARWNAERARAFAANDRCMHCEQHITDAADAWYFPDTGRFAHRGDCGVIALKQLWNHLTRGIVEPQKAA